MKVPAGLDRDSAIAIHLGERLLVLQYENPEATEIQMCYALLNYCVGMCNGSKLRYQFLRDALEGCIWRKDHGE